MGKKTSNLEDVYGLMNSDTDTGSIDIMKYIPEAEGNLSKALRDMFKFPTMMINYGSAINTVVNNVSSDAISDMFLNLLKAYNSDKTGVEHSEAKRVLQKIVDHHNTGVVASFTTVDELVKELQENEISRIGSKVASKSNPEFSSNWYPVICGSVKETQREITSPLPRLITNAARLSPWARPSIGLLAKANKPITRGTNQR
jgi:hypothetical protein